MRKSARPHIVLMFYNDAVAYVVDTRLLLNLDLQSLVDQRSSKGATVLPGLFARWGILQPSFQEYF
jgi:hypothetical protein